MKDILLHSYNLVLARGLFTDNTRIHEAISAALSETEAYAADELVDLAEEVLHQIAAVGVVHYLQHAPQKEVYNDFLVQLFNSSGHDYNAGPLFRWAANMVKECTAMQSSARYPFFWQKAEGGLRLAERVNHLSELRNQVMHGFFVLPPEKNREEADAIGQLLIDLHAVQFFDIEAEYHFFRAGHFTGHWNITEEGEWTHYFGKGAFGELAQRIVAEHKPTFWENEQAIMARSLPVNTQEGFRLDGRFSLEKNELLQPLQGLTEAAVREALKQFEVSEEFIQTIMERGAVL